MAFLVLSIRRQIKRHGKSTVGGWLGKHKGMVGRSQGPTECRPIEMNIRLDKLLVLGSTKAQIYSSGLTQGEDHGRVHRGYEVRVNERN